MNLWECEQCGCKGIAADLICCPMCFLPREQEHEGTGEEMQPVEHLADGTMSPEVSNDAEVQGETGVAEE